MDTPKIHDSRLAVELSNWYLELVHGFNTLPTTGFLAQFYSREARVSGPYGWAQQGSQGLTECFDHFKRCGVKTFKLSHFYDMGKHSEDIGYIGVVLNSVDASGTLVEQMKTDVTIRRENGVWKVFRESMAFSLETGDVFEDDSKVILGRAFNLNNPLANRQVLFETKEDPKDEPYDW